MSLLSFESYYGLTKDPTQIEIDQINNLQDEKLFVTVFGGLGVGKTSIVEKYINIPIISKDLLKEAFDNDASLVYLNSDQNYNITEKRLKEAKRNDFINILVLVESSVNKNIEKIDVNEVKEIYETMLNAIRNFYKFTRKIDLVDFYVEVNN